MTPFPVCCLHQHRNVDMAACLGNNQRRINSRMGPDWHDHHSGLSTVIKQMLWECQFHCESPSADRVIVDSHQKNVPSETQERVTPEHWFFSTDGESKQEILFSVLLSLHPPHIETLTPWLWVGLKQHWTLCMAFSGTPESYSFFSCGGPYMAMASSLKELWLRASWNGQRSAYSWMKPSSSPGGTALFYI